MSFYDLWEEYRKWLLSRCRFYDLNYEHLTTFLHNRRFIYSIHMDQNREMDGTILRDYFLNEKGYFNQEDPEIVRFLDEYCSVLEMLVSLAIRMDNDWIGNPLDPTPDRCFVIFLENLGIFEDDVSFKRRKTRIASAVDKWLSREFTFDGYGSIFPLRINEFDEDQREQEIWNQMMAYIKENPHLWEKS